MKKKNQFMNIAKGLFACLIVTATSILVGCAEDKGSYEYLDINEISISGIDAEYHVIALRAPEPAITPKLEFTMGKQADVSYSWQIDSKEVCDHPSLDVPIEVGSGEHSAMLIVTNNETGLKYYQPFTIFVETQFTYGLAVLSEREDGVSDLAFLPMTIDGDYYEPMTNVFEKLNEDWGTLGTHPVSIGLREPGDYVTNDSYMILNNGPEKTFVMLDCNSLEMKRAYSLQQMPGSPSVWNAKQLCVNSMYAFILANDKIYTFDQAGCDGLAEPKASEYKMGWVDLGGNFTGYAIPAYDENTHQFLTLLQEEGRNFTYDAAMPFNELTNSKQTAPVYLDGLTIVGADRMYNDGGFSYNNGMFGSWGRMTGTGGPEDASTQRFIFRDESGKGHFYTFDFELGYYYNMFYELEIRAINADYGVREERVISDLTFNDQTVCKALPYGRYWMIANGREVVREFYADGAQRYQFTLPAEVKGNVVAMIPNTAEDLLYVATYDSSSTADYRGSICVISLDVNGGNFGKLVKHFPNICGKTVKMTLRGS